MQFSGAILTSSDVSLFTLLTNQQDNSKHLILLQVSKLHMAYVHVVLNSVVVVLCRVS